MKLEIYQLLAEIVKTLFEVDPDGIGAGAGIAVDIPENSAHGDYTTNIAMIAASRLKAPPMQIAQQITDAIKKYQNESWLKWLDRVEIAPPGFINFWLSEEYFSTELAEVLKKKDAFGTKAKVISHQSSVISNEEKQRQKKEPVITSKTKSSQSPQTPQNPQSSEKSAGNLSQNDEIALFGNSPNSNARVTGVGGPPRRGPLVGILGGKRPAGPAPIRKIMVEFAHPNTHKAFHIGHLRNIATGESIIRLLESQGNKVIRANYQGDVGMHIAKALYALVELSPFKEEVHTVKGVKNRVEFLGKAYAAGSKAFEEDEAAKEKIKDFNYLVYAAAEKFAEERGLPKASTDYLSFVHGDKSKVEIVYQLWKETRQWSLDYFDTIYARVGSHYDRFYFESECLTGVDRAKEAVKTGVLKESEGAIIFDGKPYGIDTRVFVNGLGLPTYEGKELALSRMETTEFGDLDRIIHVVGPEQASFFKVSFKAEELLGFVKPGVQQHLIYGWVKLKHGKMSSRSGVVVLGEWLLDEAKKSIYTILDASASPLKVSPLKGREEIAEAAAIAAVKYAFLRVGTNQEIAFDLKESISFDGDSGPYLLYTYARCRSVIRRASLSDLSHLGDLSLNPEERNLARRISQFPEVVADAATRFAPNVLCTYLFHLAQEFNVFYAKHAILEKSSLLLVHGSSKNPKKDVQGITMNNKLSTMNQRLALTTATAQVLHNGLYLLGIPTVERM